MLAAVPTGGTVKVAVAAFVWLVATCRVHDPLMSLQLALQCAAEITVATLLSFLSMRCPLVALHQRVAGEHLVADVALHLLDVHVNIHVEPVLGLLGEAGGAQGALKGFEHPRVKLDFVEQVLVSCSWKQKNKKNNN